MIATRTLTALAASACFVSPAMAELQGSIEIDGSSTVFPIAEAVAEEFGAEHPEVRIELGKSGTGGGFKRFTNENPAERTDISNGSRPIKAKEAKAAKERGIEFIEVPVAYDGLTIVVNKANDWAKEMTVDDLKKIFLSDQAVTNWNQVDPSYPDTPIKIFAPGTDSGTFDYFKEVVAGKKGEIRSDMSVSEEDNVLVNGVIGDKGAIGFFGCAYYFENQDKLNAVAIVNGDGKPVLPSPTAIEDGSYNPFSRPLFMYVKKESLSKPQVAAYVDFFLESGPELAEEVGYVRLPGSVYAAAKKNVATGRTGTQYLDENGEKVHGPITQVYK
ncbi:MAG: PstS family phosphate ABC transporter substrate-binding protein [Planctomycetota bacterium]